MAKGVRGPGHCVGSPSRFRHKEERLVWPLPRRDLDNPQSLAALTVEFEMRPPLLVRQVPSQCEKGKQGPRMSHTESTLIRSNLNGELTVEGRIATALGNERERERMIAMKAHERFCSRGCEHGFDLDDWLNAERELSAEASDVVITQTEAGFDVSIAERREQGCIALSIAPSSLLILWTMDQSNSAELNSPSL